ncbi:MAG: extracellular solute-binding protein [Clostridia bacterium]|nr:extracellular solute-binding protein [Clostridia bacterium]
MKYKPFPLLLAALMLTTSCGGTSNPTNTPVDTTTAEPEVTYEFTSNYGGYEFRILNADDIWSMHASITREQQTGEVLDDAMYRRCTTLEDKLNITLNETRLGIGDDVANEARTVILAGDDAYDIMYISAPNMQEFSTQGYVHNLLDFEELQLDQPWWMESYNNANTSGGALYSAASYSQLMILDSIWCLYVNESMLEDLKLDAPYELVRSGKWTLDEFSKYIKAAANLNGDDSYDWNTDGNAVYGASGGTFDKFYKGCGELLVENVEGKLTLTAGSERFYNVFDKLVSTINQHDGTSTVGIGGNDGDPGNYIGIFMDERSLFLLAEVCKTNLMRNEEYSFGIVPYPKYDELQERYYSTAFSHTPSLTIPVTVADPVRSAVVSDALAYLSWDIVLPVFRNVTLEQKNLRNEESIEMLDIIFDSVVPDVGTTVPAVNSMTSELTTMVYISETNTASILATYKEQIETELAEMNEQR